MGAFWISLFGVFFLEMGDKTQLVAMSLASKFNAWITLAGVAAATLVVHLISIALGGGAGKFMSPNWIGFLAGIAFIGFGLWTYRGDCLDDDEAPKCGTRGAFACVFTTFFLAELGDKTMLGTVALASNHSLIPVWLGSSLGMVVADGLAMLVGLFLGKKLPEKAIRIGASAIFLGFGAFSVISKGILLPHYAWAIAGVSLVVLGWIFLRPQPKHVCVLPVNEPQAEDVKAGK
ncbi:MAG: TMEM165/GDT1 family protein [Armatimonadetes bacterium]|nr:TMEM165/GDT1 family protein [Armatimonadota bacterium]